MSWFTLLKGQVYYHIASPEIAKQIVEHQMIPKEYDGKLSWVKEGIENRKNLRISDYTTVNRTKHLKPEERKIGGKLRSKKWMDEYFREHPKELEEWRTLLQDKHPEVNPNVPEGIGNIPPSKKIILFWKDLEDAKAWYHAKKFNAQMEDVEDDTRAEMLKCDIDVKCIPFPRPIAIHTPTERKPNFPRQNMHDRWMNPNTRRLEGNRTYRGGFNTELLHSGYYHPTGEEDIPGIFEVVSL